jgi:CelD/BcsL family acetyltransferase involved in cellulose biosynthesis
MAQLQVQTPTAQTLHHPHQPDSPAEPVLKHRIYDTFEQARPLRDAWDDLAARTGDVFASYDWGDVWWHHYGAKRRLQIHVVHADQHLVAVVPLFRETLHPLGVPLRVVRLVGCDHVLTPTGLAIEQDHAHAVVRLLVDSLEHQGGWDLLHLGPLQYYMQITDAMADAFADQPAVGEVITGTRDSCVTVYGIPETYEKYLAGLQGSERRNILRCERNAVADRMVRANVPASQQDASRAMTDLVRLHQGLWVGKGKLGQFRDWPRYELFHADLAERLMLAGRLALVTLRTDEAVVGVEYGCHFGPRTHALIRGYCDDVVWRTYSIGRMLHCHMVQQAIARGATLMDDGRGAFEYKRRLGGQLRCERSLTVVRRGRTARLRTWLAMRTAWCVHALYNRIWFDWLRPQLPLPAAPLCRSYIRMSFLAQLLKRAHFPLRPGTRFGHALSSHAEPACPLARSVTPDAPVKTDGDGPPPTPHK